MNEGLINSRISWLSQTLAAQRNNITTLLLRLRGMGASAGSGIALHRKFMRLLEQVSHDREKELGILNEIDEVEKQHQDLRQRKLLRQADPTFRPEENRVLEAEKAPERNGLIKLLGLMLFFSGMRIKHKKQVPTVD